MTTPKIEALAITQEWGPTRWRATGHVEGIGWLEAWGPSLLDAMHALQALAAKRVAERGDSDTGYVVSANHLYGFDQFKALGHIW